MPVGLSTHAAGLPPASECLIAPFMTPTAGDKPGAQAVSLIGSGSKSLQVVATLALHTKPVPREFEGLQRCVLLHCIYYFRKKLCSTAFKQSTE